MGGFWGALQAPLSGSGAEAQDADDFGKFFDKIGSSLYYGATDVFTVTACPSRHNTGIITMLRRYGNNYILPFI